MKNNQKIPEGWSVKKLGEVCIKKGQYGANAPAVPYNCSLPTYLRITDIDEDGQYSILNRASVDISDYKNYLLKKGDIVFARTGATTGKTYLYKEKDGCLVFAGFLIKFSPNNSLIAPYYLKLLTCTPLYNHWVEIMSVRSGQPGINADEYAQYPLLLPPLAEQEKIAEILGTWDEAIEKLTSLIEQKKLLKKGLMQKLLTGKVRLKGFTQPWKEVKLGNFCRTFSGGTPSVNNASFYDGNIPFIRSGEIHLISTALFISESGLTNSAAKLVEKGDILFALYGATSGEVDISKINGAINQAILCIKPLSLNKYFLKDILEYKKQNILNKYLQGGQGNLSAEIIKSLKIYIPSDISEQQAIANVLSTADDEINLLNQKLEALKEQKKGLMQQLLTGQVRVKVN